MSRIYLDLLTTIAAHMPNISDLQAISICMISTVAEELLNSSVQYGAVFSEFQEGISHKGDT